MSAAPALAKEIPIAVFGDLGFAFELVQKSMPSSSLANCTRVPSMVDAFQLIINKSRGILVLRMENKQTLSDFAKVFQMAIRQLNLSQVKIVIFSSQNEILNSRALTQFPFIRTLTPVSDAQRLVSILLGECQSIHTKSAKKRPDSNSLSSGIIVIKGDSAPAPGLAPMIQDRHRDGGHQIVSGSIADPEAKSDWAADAGASAGRTSAKPTSPAPPTTQKPLSTPPWIQAQTEDDKEKIMQQCLGQNVPTFIYNEELSWRVRGYYSQFNSAENTVTFVASHEAGAAKIKEEIRKSNLQFLSSSSTAKARICSLVSFLTDCNLEFVFRTPAKVQGIQRRVNQRAKMTMDLPVLVQYYDERLGADRTLNVLDMSVGGMGIRLDKDFVVDFETGRRISNLNLFLFNRVIRIPEAEVRHCSKSDINPDFKILGLLMTGLNQTDLNFIEMFVLSQFAGEPTQAQ